MSSLLQSLLLFPQPGLQHHTPVGAPFTEMALEMAPPGVMPFGGSRDSPLLCGFTALVVIWLLSCPTLHDPMDCNTPGSLSFIISQSLFILMSIELMMPSSHLILCRPLLLLPSIFPSIRIFSSESALRIRWPKYWSFSISISPSNENSGFVSFRIDWFDLLAVPGTLKSLLQHHSLKASILQRSPFFTVQLSHPYMTPGKTIGLMKQTRLGYSYNDAQ